MVLKLYPISRSYLQDTKELNILIFVALRSVAEAKHKDQPSATELSDLPQDNQTLADWRFFYRDARYIGHHIGIGRYMLIFNVIIIGQIRK